MWVYPCPRVDPWVRSTSPAEALEVDGNIALTGTVDGRDVAADGTKLDGIASGADVGDITGVTAGTGLTGGGTSGVPTLTLAASPAFTNPTCSTPTSSTHIANKAYVDAATPTMYIVTTRSTMGGSWSSPSYPAAYCPSGWNEVTNWTWYEIKWWSGANQTVGIKQTLCSK